MAAERVVFDTNALVSRLLAPNSVPAAAVRHALAQCQVLVSAATTMELADVLGRAKFDPYVTIEERKAFLVLFGRVAETIEIVRTIRACRDARDDKFLELAVNGQANCIVTGDNDLLVLHPFQSIPIVTPARYLDLKVP